MHCSGCAQLIIPSHQQGCQWDGCGHCWVVGPLMRVLGTETEGATSLFHGTCWTASTSCRAGLLGVCIADLMLYHLLEQQINWRPHVIQA